MYNPSEIEKKWQKAWEVAGVNKMSQDLSGKKFYVLGAWAYPSGDAHMGHVRNYTITDIIARFKKMEGYKVLNPVGWDAFGLPTENAALKRSMEPSEWNVICTKKMENQFRSLGFSYDWDLVVDTSFPEYYRWTQWLLIKFWERGLLYKDRRLVNWCTSCQTVLANEQVNENQRCERCGSEVVSKDMDQWFLRITSYADRLLEDMKLLVDWPAHVKKMQENWIGKGSGDDKSFRLQDWCISRQRYWGAPIPFVECEHCGISPVSERDLPVLLPKGVDFSPGWPPPLARDEVFVNVECPQCGAKARRSVEVMDTFVFSAYYYLRFVDPLNSKELCGSEAEKFWMNVDFYISGVELVNNHLIYARFFHKVLFDMGIVSTPEPFKQFFAQGMVLLGGEKMSKSKGNIVSPVDIVEKYGADTLRVFILFVGPPESDVNWDDNGIRGCLKFLQRFHNVIISAASAYDATWKQKFPEGLNKTDEKIRAKVNQAIARVTEVISKSFNFNTAIAILMELTRDFEVYLRGDVNTFVVSEAMESMTKLISPFAPHVAQELWSLMGFNGFICESEWPEIDEKLAKKCEFVIAVQVKGKTKGTIIVSEDKSGNKEYIIKKAKSLLEKKAISSSYGKIIFVPGKVINFV